MQAAYLERQVAKFIIAIMLAQLRVQSIQVE